MLSGIDLLTEVGPPVLGAVLGGGGMAWLTKLLFGRMIQQYDKRHNYHARKTEELTRELAIAMTRIAVHESVLEDTRRLRIDLEQRASQLRGEFETRFTLVGDDIEEFRRDLFVAHERLRRLASGDTDLDKVQAPPRVRRR